MPRSIPFLDDNECDASLYDSTISPRPVLQSAGIRLADADSQFLQLSFTHRSGRVHHEIDRARSLWEWDDFAQAFRTGQNHHNAIQSERDATMRRRSIFQRLQKESETRARLFIAHAQRLKIFA